MRRHCSHIDALRALRCRLFLAGIKGCPNTALLSFWSGLVPQHPKIAALIVLFSGCE
jgi:hypothetical protein